MERRSPIGFVVATVQFPLYAGDKTERDYWPDFIYEEPGVTAQGNLAVCRRTCQTLEAKVEMVPTAPVSGENSNG